MAGPQHQTRQRLINSAPSAAPRSNAEQHQKTITVDNTTAAVGTGNLTPQYYSTSRDTWVLDTSPTDATFDADYSTIRAPELGQPRSWMRSSPGACPSASAGSTTCAPHLRTSALIVSGSPTMSCIFPAETLTALIETAQFSLTESLRALHCRMRRPTGRIGTRRSSSPGSTRRGQTNHRIPPDNYPWFKPTGQVPGQRPSAGVEHVGQHPEGVSGVPTVGHLGESLGHSSQSCGHRTPLRAGPRVASPSSSVSRVFSVPDMTPH